jgi:membrane associated rhomboid family serine protease
MTFAIFQLEESYVSEYLVFSGINLRQGRIWTPITALFIHADITHLFGNMIFLYVFGNTLENELKTSKTLIIFFIGGIVSFLLSVFFYEANVSMVGASAAIFSMAAVVMFLKPMRFSLVFMMPLGLVAILYLIYNVLAVHYDLQGNVAYLSHIVGFTIGIPFGIAWSKKWIKNFVITSILLILYSLLQLYVIPEILNADLLQILGI